MIRTIQANEETLRDFQYDGIEKEMLDKFDWRARLAEYYRIGRTWAMMNESKNPVMLYGLFETSPMVLQAWMLFNRASSFYAKTIASDIKAHLRRELKTFHRVQTLVLSGDTAARYVSIMGFKKESTLKCFGPNKEDADMYAAVNP